MKSSRHNVGDWPRGRQCHVWFVWLMGCMNTEVAATSTKWLKEVQASLPFTGLCHANSWARQGTKRSFTAWKLHNDFLLTSYRNSLATFLHQTLWKIQLHWNAHSETFQNKIKERKITSPVQLDLFEVHAWASGRKLSFTSYCTWAGWPSWCGLVVIKNKVKKSSQGSFFKQSWNMKEMQMWVKQPLG